MAYRWQQDRGNYGRSWERPKPAAHHDKGNKEEAPHNPRPNSSANNDDDDNHHADHADRYKEMYGSRRPGYNVSHRSNQPWERSKDPADDDTGDKEEASHKPQPISSADAVTSKYPGDDDGGAYAAHTSRWSAYNAPQPSNRQWDRSKARTDDDDHRSDDKEEASQKPPPDAPAARAAGKREENKDGRAAGRSGDDPWANRHRQIPNPNPNPNPNGRQFGYGRSNPSVSFSQGDDQEEEGDDEKKLREDYATRFALSPGRRHVVARNPGEPSQCEQPKVVVVKKLELHLEHNKIENFRWRKGGNRGGKKQ